MSRVDNLVEKIDSLLVKKQSFDYQAVSQDEDELHELIEKIVAKEDAMPNDVRSYSYDLKKYYDANLEKGSAVDAMLADLLIDIFDDEKFDEDDALSTREDIEDAINESPAEVETRINNILGCDFWDEGIYVLIILEHYEYAKDIWTSADFSYMRNLVDAKPSISMLLCSNIVAAQVSDDPPGSSAFYNIFGENVL